MRLPPWAIQHGASGSPQSFAYLRTRAHDLLEVLGAAQVAHLGGDLLSHLERTEAILHEWGATDAVALAGLCHAAYGTDGFATSLLPLDGRDRLGVVIGAEAEALVYLYACCDRASVYPQLGKPAIAFRDRFTRENLHPDAIWLGSFAELTAANELELIRSAVITDPKTIAALADLFDQLATYPATGVQLAAAEARAGAAGDTTHPSS